MVRFWTPQCYAAIAGRRDTASPRPRQGVAWQRQVRLRRVLAGGPAVEQPGEILERDEMDIDAREVALAHQVLELRGVQVLEVLLRHAIHARKLHLAAALFLLQGGLHGEGLEQ